jgi:pyruvate dehydrogenase E1 component beta subunit
MPSDTPYEHRVFFREAICRAVREAMEEDPRVMVMGQDVGAFGGAYREFDGLFAQFGATRVRDTPVAEASMVGLGVGAAAAGLRPLVSLTYMDFVLLALDPLVNYAAKARFKTAGQITAPLVLKLTAGPRGRESCIHNRSNPG